jgi:3-hydroxyisobutyrate dehydrogenase-like beta-hydroxyacid dehydrogenase
MKVGFVGLGDIGKPMALRLAASPHDLTVYDVAPGPLAELASVGASVAGDVASLAADVEVLCIMVRDDDQVREVLDGLLTDPHEGLVVVVHSTVAPETPEELAALASGRGVRLVDAPVSGGPVGASEGTLAIMVGGDAADFTRIEDVLGHLGNEIVHAGPVGAGTRFKLARNLIHFVSFAAVTEAQRLAEAAGLDLRALGDVVRHTDAITGGPGAIMHRTTTAPIEPGDFWYDVFGHVLALGDKDLGLAIGMADDLGVDVPLARVALERLGPGLGLSGS